MILRPAECSQLSDINKMEITDPDIQMRLAAFDRVQKLSQIHERLTAKELNPGFIFERTHYLFINRQRGIFKPRQMKYLLLIKSVYTGSEGALSGIKLVGN